MTEDGMPTDKVALTFGEGDYLVEIFAEPLDHRPVKAFLTESPEAAALQLIEYHQRCILQMNLEGTMYPSVYQGAGSGNGEWEYPWMTRWKFENRAQLTKTQEGLLEGIINMRNHYVSALESSQRYMTSTEPVN